MVYWVSLGGRNSTSVVSLDFNIQLQYGTVDAADIVTVPMECREHTLRQAIDHTEGAFADPVQHLLEARDVNSRESGLGFPNFEEASEDINKPRI